MKMLPTGLAEPGPTAYSWRRDVLKGFRPPTPGKDRSNLNWTSSSPRRADQASQVAKDDVMCPYTRTRAGRAAPRPGLHTAASR